VRGIHATAAAAYLDDEVAKSIKMQRASSWGKTGVFAELQSALSAAGVPGEVVRAIRAQAPSWPALSQVSHS
jgi:hypothetical protein